MLTELLSQPLPVLIVLAVAVVVQLALAVTALVLLARMQRDRVLLGMKWPWVLIIVFINIVGPIVFFAVGRRPAPAVESSASTDDATDVARTVASLYGNSPQ